MQIAEMALQSGGSGTIWLEHMLITARGWVGPEGTLPVRVQALTGKKLAKNGLNLVKIAKILRLFEGKKSAPSAANQQLLPIRHFYCYFLLFSL